MRRAILSLLAVALVIPVVNFVPAFAVSTTLVINEIDYDQPSTDTAEFLEIKNVSGAAVDFTGHSVRLVNGTGGGATVYQTIALPSTTLAAGDYFVVCANAATVVAVEAATAPPTSCVARRAASHRPCPSSLNR
jgi:hypothetical protein